MIQKEDQSASKVTLNTFPEDPAARVKLAMAMASSMIAHAKEPITEKNCIYLSGEELIAVRYLWTALVVLGSRHKEWKFDHKAIKIRRSDYSDDVKKELGWFSTFSSESLYETEFKQRLTDDMFVITKYPQAYSEVPEGANLPIEEQAAYVVRERARVIQEAADRAEQERIKKEAEAQAELARAKKLRDDAETARLARVQEETRRAREIIVTVPAFPISDPATYVRYSMALASRTIASLTKVPSAEYPITLSGATGEALHYYWTALIVFVLFGKNINSSINLRTIKLPERASFNPAQELQGTSFSTGSLYETIFKHYLTNDMLVVTRTPQAFESISVRLYPSIEQQVVHVQEIAVRKEQAMIAELRSQPSGENETSASSADISVLARKLIQDKQIEQARTYLEGKREEDAVRREMARKQEEVRRQEEARKREEARKQEEIMRQNEARRQEAARKQEEARRQEAARREAEARLHQGRISPSQVDALRQSAIKGLLGSAQRPSQFRQQSSQAAPSTAQINAYKALLSRMSNTETVISLTSVIDAINDHQIAINAQYDKGYTLLMNAIDLRREDIAEYLLRHKNANPFLRASNGLRAVDLVPQSMPLYELMMSLEHEFNPELSINHQLMNMLKKPGANLLHIQALLLRGADINFQDPLDGSSCLMHSVVLQGDHISEYLLRLGANPLIANRAMSIASDLVSRNASIYPLLKQKELEQRRSILSQGERCSLLLQDDVVLPQVRTTQIDTHLAEGADINYQNLDGDTALTLAVDAQNERVAEYLLRNNANPFLKNKHNKSARDMVSRGSSMYQTLMGYELLYATATENLPLITSLLNADQTIIDFQGGQGRCALSIAVEAGLEPIVAYLLEQGANMHMNRDDGKSIQELAPNEAIRNLLTPPDVAPVLDELEEEEAEAEVEAELSDDSSGEYGFFGHSRRKI